MLLFEYQPLIKESPWLEWVQPRAELLMCPTSSHRESQPEARQPSSIRQGDPDCLQVTCSSCLSCYACTHTHMHRSRCGSIKHQMAMNSSPALCTVCWSNSLLRLPLYVHLEVRCLVCHTLAPLLPPPAAVKRVAALARAELAHAAAVAGSPDILLKVDLSRGDEVWTRLHLSGAV